MQMLWINLIMDWLSRVATEPPDDALLDEFQSLVSDSIIGADVVQHGRPRDVVIAVMMLLL